MHWPHLPLTPSTTLKKFDEPTVNVRATASLTGASSWSSFSSWFPSCRRRPMSETTERFWLQGCLYVPRKLTEITLAEKCHITLVLLYQTEQDPLFFPRPRKHSFAWIQISTEDWSLLLNSCDRLYGHDQKITSVELVVITDQLPP